MLPTLSQKAATDIRVIRNLAIAWFVLSIAGVLVYYISQQLNAEVPYD
jgi:hypothetical protein